MKLFTTTLAIATATGALFAAAPAAAQVNGIAISDTPVAVARAQALQTGYQQINTQYQAQITTLTQYQQQRNQLIQGLDSDGDGQLSEAEANAAPDATVEQIRQIDQQIETTQAPITLARIYVVSQVAAQYGPAVQQVIQNRNIQIMLSPDAVVYAPEAVDVTAAVTTTLNTLVPTVQIVPPPNWQPTQAGAQLFQQIQQLMVLSELQRRQAEAQQQGQQPQAPAQPSGR